VLRRIAGRLILERGAPRRQIVATRARLPSEIGEHARAYPYLVAEMAAQGHDVGDHTFHHPNMTTVDAATAAFEQLLPYANDLGLYAEEIEPDTGEVRLASAGHLPPIVVGRDGGRVVDITPAAPLGAFSYGRVPEQSLLLAPGETLVFYTDGLIERPGTPLTESIEELLAVLRGAASVDATECACAVLDLDLGDGDGVGVAEALRKGAPALRVAFFSSDTNGGLVERAKAIGPVFKKPDDLEALVAWVLE